MLVAVVVEKKQGSKQGKGGKEGGREKRGRNDECSGYLFFFVFVFVCLVRVAFLVLSGWAQVVFEETKEKRHGGMSAFSFSACCLVV